MPRDGICLGWVVTNVSAHGVWPELEVFDQEAGRKGFVGGGEEEDGVCRDGKAAIRGLEDALVNGAAHLAVDVGRHLARASPAATHRDNDPAQSKPVSFIENII